MLYIFYDKSTKKVKGYLSINAEIDFPEKPFIIVDDKFLSMLTNIDKLYVDVKKKEIYFQETDEENTLRRSRLIGEIVTETFLAQKRSQAALEKQVDILIKIVMTLLKNSLTEDNKTTFLKCLETIDVYSSLTETTEEYLLDKVDSIISAKSVLRHITETIKHLEDQYIPNPVDRKIKWQKFLDAEIRSLSEDAPEIRGLAKILGKTTKEMRDEMVSLCKTKGLLSKDL